jgi:hypothetical protein
MGPAKIAMVRLRKYIMNLKLEWIGDLTHVYYSEKWKVFIKIIYIYIYIYI